MSYAVLGIRGLVGGVFSRGIDKTLMPFGNDADFFRIVAWDEAEPDFAALQSFNGKIIILCHSFGWKPTAELVPRYLAGKDVWIFSLDPAKQYFDGQVPLVSPVAKSRHVNIWQSIPIPQKFGPVEGAENFAWPEPGHSALDDRKGVQDLVQGRIKAILATEKEPDMPGKMFEQWTPAFMKMAMADFDLTVEDAAAIFGNAGHESAGYETLQEIKPVVPGSRGGYGIMQWTGPRRVQFEAYCKRNGYDPSDMMANYKWLWNELKGPEGKVLSKLKAARTLADKVKVFSDTFLRPGIPHMESRIKWAERALAIWKDAQIVDVPAPVDPKPEMPEYGDIEAFLAGRYPTIEEEARKRAAMLADAIAYRFQPHQSEPLLTLPVPMETKNEEYNMGNYSKLIGSLVGGVLGLLVAKNVIPAEFNTPDVQAAVTVLVSAFAVWAFPANKLS